MGSSRRTGSCHLLPGQDGDLLHASRLDQDRWKYPANSLRCPQFPAATLLLIRSRQSHFYRLRASQLASFQPAASIIRSRAPSALPGPSNPILVHTFSNGGCFGLRTVNELFEQPAAKGELQPLLEEKGKGLPARAVVFDSCPGDTDLRISIRAFTAPLRSLWTKIPASALVAFFYAFAKLSNLFVGSFALGTSETNADARSIRRKPSTLHLMGTYLNSNLPPVPRLYIYSPEDLLIPAPHVEAHAAVAKSNGVDVRLEKFDGTQHVSHVRGPGNEQRYWAAVRSLWERSGATKA